MPENSHPSGRQMCQKLDGRICSNRQARTNQTFQPYPRAGVFSIPARRRSNHPPRDLLGDRSVNLRLDPDDGPHPEVEVCDLDLHVPDAN